MALSQLISGCPKFRNVEDSVIQQLDIMSLALRASLRLNKDTKIREFLVRGVQAGKKLETTIEKMRYDYEKDCHDKFTS